jgi:L-ascorbate metabolism protein UlaG (beta-lactamase superfamily)
MEIQLVRSATMRIGYAGYLIVTDPYLAAKHTRPTYAGKSMNPTSDLPCTPEEAVAGADAAILSHLHSDHFDAEGQRVLPRGLPVVCQPCDEATLTEKGFTKLLPAADTVTWGGVTITRVPGMHGTGAVLQAMGEASGFVLKAHGEPTLYWAGDTILSDGVREAITRFKPDVVVTHSCGAAWKGTPILIGAEETVEVCRLTPRGKVVAVHMDSVDHATVTRSELRAYADTHGVAPNRLLIPKDLEKTTF